MLKDQQSLTNVLKDKTFKMCNTLDLVQPPANGVYLGWWTLMNAARCRRKTGRRWWRSEEVLQGHDSAWSLNGSHTTVLFLFSVFVCKCRFDLYVVDQIRQAVRVSNQQFGGGRAFLNSNLKHQGREIIKINYTTGLLWAHYGAVNHTFCTNINIRSLFTILNWTFTDLLFCQATCAGGAFG